MVRLWGVAFAAGLLAAMPAFAGGLFGGGPELAPYLGQWTAGKDDPSGLVRLTIGQAGPSHVRIQVLGRCASTDCDWGTEVAQNYASDPGSDAVRALVATFESQGIKRRLTLHQGPGNSLRYDLFTDHASPGQDFEAEGTLVAAPVEVANQTANTRQSAATPTGPASFVEGLFSGAANGKPQTQSTGQEDCVPLNLNDLFVAPTERGFEFRDFNHVILNFGPDQKTALKAKALVAYYRFDEQCFVARPHATMIYWKNAGEVPHAELKGADCRTVHPEAVKAARDSGSWKVADGTDMLLDFGGDRASAELAAAIIRSYRFTRECFADKTDPTMQYWIAVPP